MLVVLLEHVVKCSYRAWEELAIVRLQLRLDSITVSMEAELFVTTCWWRHLLTHHGRSIVQAEAIELLREWSLAVVLVLLDLQLLLPSVFEDLRAGLNWCFIVIRVIKIFLVAVLFIGKFHQSIFMLLLSFLVNGQLPPQPVLLRLFEDHTVILFVPTGW